MQEAFKQQPKRGTDAAIQSSCIKRCRDLGHRKKFNDKLKTDPIWNVYHKGYKAHYARYLKKKMTQAEFQKWADYAIVLRNKALDGEIEYDEYVREMKK